MLIIEKNAVYEVDCECLQKKRGRYANLTCEERQIEKETDYCGQQAAYAKNHFLIQEKASTVAILDTGLYPHPDFKDRIVGWYDAIGHEAYPVDPNGHGTQEGGN